MKTEIKEYAYGCDGGSITITNSRRTYFRIFNNTGDGEYKFYVLLADGWGPKMYDNQEEFNKYAHEINDGWESTDIHFDNSKTCGQWQVMFYDLDIDYDEDEKLGVKLPGKYIEVFRRDDDFLFVCYRVG